MLWAVEVSSVWLPDQIPESELVDIRPGVYKLSQYEAGIIAQARSMLDWNARYVYCPSCGSPTKSAEAGYKRVCVNLECLAQRGAQNFAYPRTDAVCIIHITSKDGSRCLLGRKVEWPENMYSCIAGFIEPGETLENAGRREALEETGIQVGTVKYHSSQPWPFPSQLMLGCVGVAETEEITMIDDELEDARWFDIKEVVEMLKGASLYTLPKSHAIAHELIKSWAMAPPRLTMSLFFYRNIVNPHVIVTEGALIKPQHLSQLGVIVKPPAIQHGRKKPAPPPMWERLRTDHWKPFAVLKGFKSPETQTALLTKLTQNVASELGRYYAHKDHEMFIKKWEPSAQMKEKTIQLCEALNAVQDNDEALSVYWERMEYRDIIDDHRMFWPDNLSHQKLLDYIIREKFDRGVPMASRLKISRPQLESKCIR